MKLTGQVKKSLFLGLFLGIVLGGFILTGAVLAQSVADSNSTLNQGMQVIKEPLGLPATDIRTIVANIIRVFLGLLGIIAVVLMIYAGYLWMTAGGDEEKISQSKKIMINAVIGLAIILSSYAIVSFVMSKLLEATTGVPGHCSDGSFDPETEEQKDCGNECPACFVCTPGDVGCPTFPSNVFYVDQLPAGGDVCIRNVKLAIVFNEPVDISTLVDNVTVKNASGEEARVSWSNSGNNKNIAIFTPGMECGGTDNGMDCLASSTEYILDILDANAKNIKNLAGTRSLSCGFGAGCKEVKFKTGDGIDRVGPTLSMFAVSPSASGVVLPVDVSYNDDNGIQNISLYANNNYITSQAISGCKKTGTVKLYWDTKNLIGNQSLKSVGLDWAAIIGEATTTVDLKPAQCFDSNNQPICGPGCGNCPGEGCTKDTECASGYCEITGDKGICVEKAKITHVSPLSGATSTFVSVSGYYFGTTPGKVYFSKKSSPNKNNLNDWTEASLAGCTVSTWSNHQVIVEVATTAVTGPLMIETASTTMGGVERKFFDTTNDNFGQKIDNFVTNGQIRPSLCPISPNSGLPADQSILHGKNFSGTQGSVTFGNLNSQIKGWANNDIIAVVPLLDKGPVGVRVFDSNKAESNSVYFYVNSAVGSGFPIISDVSPTSAAKGSYITVTGKNFGEIKGKVLFFNTNGTNGVGLEGNLSGFPIECKDELWHDGQIIVKLPDAVEVGKKYFVQVVVGTKQSEKNGPTVTVVAGLPAPSICKIDPDNGPIPYLQNEYIKLFGDHFIDGANHAQVFFWKADASLDSITGRINATDISTTTGNLTNSLINVHPPTTVQTGPVVAYTDKIGNQVQFTVNNCVKDGCKTATDHCCASGSQIGVCKPVVEKCEGEILSTGYIWRFSTKDIPVPLRVVERCDDQVGTEKFPSPSPSIIWNIPGVPTDHTSVCRGATTLIEFNRIDVGASTQKSISSNALVVQECGGGVTDTKAVDCQGPITTVTMQGKNNSILSYSIETASNNNSYLELNPNIVYNGGQWKDNTWYRVVLKNSITAGTGTTTAPLFADKPCDVTNSAYCFVFKTGQEDCKIKKVLVAPYEFTTRLLEPIIKKYSFTSIDNLYYSGHGLSTQRCIMMGMNGFGWNWSSSQVDYSQIVSGTTTQDQVLVSALQNTVGVSLINPTDALNIQADATKNAKTYSGTSTLTIDLSNPEVVAYEPNCLEACTNAQIAVKFNVGMSNKNLNTNKAIKLFKCNDENCLSTSPINITDTKFITASNNTYIQIIPTSLEKESLYKVIVSASSTTPLTNTEMLWSGKKLSDPASFSKPYNQEFTWRFRTKKEACQVDRVEVNPANYFASSLFDRTIYTASMFSAPDACSAIGQKLDPGTVGWNWDSTDKNVATTTSFTTIGKNPYCTANCIRKGSDIPAVSSTVFSNFPVCGNGKVEAGEDCDAPDANTGCGLNCLYMGNAVSGKTGTANVCGNGIIEKSKGEECDPGDANTKVGCSATCLHTGSLLSTGAGDVNASICANGMLGSGEDCDLGIASNYLSPTSSLNCTANCLHQGTRLSTKWCIDNKTAMGGFTTSSYNSYCKQAYSQCGDGEQNPDEDPGCDGGKGWASGFCNEYCLFKQGITFGDVVDDQCDLIKSSEGCSEINKQHIGSSLLYSKPSVCGDGITGIGEDGDCEQADGGFVINKSSLVNPWVLAIGVGKGVPSGNPLSQKTDIKGDINPTTNGGKTKGSSGKFLIECGYLTDSDCADTTYGVANDTCCYARTHLTGVFPGATTSPTNYFDAIPATSANICPNTTIEAHFDGVIAQPTLQGNVFLARRVESGICGTALDVTDKVKLAFGGTDDAVWYQKIWQKFIKFLAGMFGAEVSAGVDAWCAFGGAGSAIVIPDAIGSGSQISVGLTKPLDFNTDFIMVLGANIKDIRGVRIGDVKVTSSGTTKKQSIFWRFKTGGKICEISDLVVSPDQYVFSRPGVTTTLWAIGKTASGQSIQGIPSFYDWNIAWGPYVNGFVYLTSTTLKSNVITSQNHDGEIDVRASANITANQYTKQKGLVATGRSHIIVFLCENPWPPKDLLLDNGQSVMVFPYEDKVGNNDGVSTTGKFDNSSIPPSIGNGYFNFSTYYCADNGSTGLYDDLPYMKPAVQVDQAIVSASSSLKRFIFTGDKAYDNSAIGIQVFPNNDHLSVNQWLKNSQEFGGKNFSNITLQNLKVDGYNAVSDGNNIYVDALNFNFDNANNPTGNLYSNIYLFSISENASAETRAVFDQMIKNLHFNANLTNYGYCGASMANPGVDFQCTTDFDCANGQVCSVQTDKLKRDYLRLQDLSSIEKSLINYQTTNKKYPNMSGGTYLDGQTVSTWSSSWGLLGSTLGTGALPVDQINRLGPAGTCASSTETFCLNNTNCVAPDTCLLHSPVDGWSTENNRYSFSCNTSSLAYRYIFSSSTIGYTIRGRYESIISYINNWPSDFVNKFIQTKANFVMSAGNNGTGICLQNEEVSTLKAKGICGDGTINLDLNEVCDTKLIDKEYGPNGPVCVNNVITFDICNADCSGWTASTTPCDTLSKCGNDKQEPGEFCDDGDLNGTYNKCDVGCKTFGALGYCGDNTLQSEYEFCDNSTGAGLAKCLFASSTGITEQFDEVPIFYFLVDLSGSMLLDFDGCSVNGINPTTGKSCTFDNTSRFEYVKKNLPLVAEKLYNKIKIGIATFEGSNTSPNINEILSVGIYTKDQITDAIKKLIPDGATPTGLGVKKVKEDYLQSLSLDDYLVSKNLVLVTDGNENVNMPEGNKALTQITKLKNEDSVLTYVLAIAIKSDNFEKWAVAGGTSPYISVKDNTSLADKINQFYLSKPCKPYSFTKNYSCKWDCSGLGSYCGDGIVDGPEEQCEEDQTCSIDGKEGVKKCSSCQKQNAVAIGNWGFSSSYPSGTKTKFKDDVSANHFICDAGKCPTVVDGKYNKGLVFNGSNTFVSTVSNQKFDSSEFTVSTWINPSVSTWQEGIIEKLGTNFQNGGFALRYGQGPGVVQPSIFFTVYGNGQSDVTSTVLVPINQWTHIVASYDINNVPKLYVNGQLEKVGKAIAPKNNNSGFVVGRAITTSSTVFNFFKGKIDELSYYNRSLSDAEIKDLYNTNWFCSTSVKVAEAETKPEEGYCGDEIKQPELGEDCDNGKDNGKECVAGYDQSCTYCTDITCQRVIVNETGYCGDGIINGGEVCDTDPVSKIIYASATSTGTWLSTTTGKFGYQVKKCGEENDTKINLGKLSGGNYTSWTDTDNLLTKKKGTKSCTNNCSLIVVDCAECGLSANGVAVSGELVNVLEPQTVNDTVNETQNGQTVPVPAQWINPLYNEVVNKHGSWNFNEVRLVYTSSTAKLNVSEESQYSVAMSSSTIHMFSLKPYPKTTGDNALINTDPRCSAYDGTDRYYLQFNNDRQMKHAVPIDISSAETAGQYDQILSPIIRLTNYSTSSGYAVDNISTLLAQPRHLRIVVSWRGINDLTTGFLVPSTTPLHDDVLFTTLTGGWATSIFYYNHSIGKMAGVWYHGISDTDSGLHVKSYTVDLDNITKTGNTGTYGFYIHSPELPIQSYFSDNVKVAVYIPENEEVNGDKSWRHFSRPAKVFELNGAYASNNLSARYWHVFNVNTLVNATGDPASLYSLNNFDAVGLNSIRTDLELSY